MTKPPAGQEPVAVLRSEQQLAVDVQWVTSGRVSFTRRIVSESRQVTVTVRREELVIEHTPLPEDPVQGVPAPVEPAVFVLREQVPVVELVTRPYEQVRVTVERVTDEQTVTAQLEREQLELTGDGSGQPGRD